MSHPAWGQQWSNGSGGAIYYNGGNVGVGTASPAFPLDVNGAIRATGATFPATGAGVELQYFSGNAYVEGYNWTALAYVPLYLRGSNVILDQGNVGIGTMNPQYPLSVKGTIGAEEVIVTNTGWSDYVFRPGYRLRPLSEVGAYIRANQHLPDIPSEAKVKAKGVSVGDMQSKLLAKVEELTLHMIQQERENRELRQRIARLEKGAAPAQTPSAAK